jgi:hypothetical protein
MAMVQLWGDVVEGKLASAEEAVEAQTQTNALLEDVEAIVETKRTEVWGSGAQCFWTQIL